MYINMAMSATSWSAELPKGSVQDRHF